MYRLAQVELRIRTVNDAGIGLAMLLRGLVYRLPWKGTLLQASGLAAPNKPTRAGPGKRVSVVVLSKRLRTSTRVLSTIMCKGTRARVHVEPLNCARNRAHEHVQEYA